MDDLFGTPGAAPPPERQLELAPLGFAAEREAVPDPWWRPVSRARGVVTAVAFGAGALWFAMPLPAVLGLPAAAVAIQCLRRWPVARWLLWSVTISVFWSEAMIVPHQWLLRFAAWMLLVTPVISYAGSQLRDF